jgi:hypothetical protein
VGHREDDLGHPTIWPDLDWKTLTLTTRKCNHKLERCRQIRVAIN